ncbi:MAG: ferrous iron transport protein B [bacterium]
MTAPIQAPLKKSTARPLVALVGNPNTGKSTLFNRLTGLRQHIANYPGITVEKKSGLLRAGGVDIDLLDLPGCYSLTAISNDERVVMDVLGGRRGLQKPDLLVFVLDATNLKRNLLLVSQCAELGIPALIALNQCDAAKRNGIRIDVDLLSKRLGVPVVETIATRGSGLGDLKEAIVAALNAPSILPKIEWPDCITHGCGLLRAGLQRAGSGDLSQAEALRVLFDSESVFACGVSDKTCLKKLLDSAHSEIRESGLNPGSAEAVIHYRHLESLLNGVIEASGPIARSHDSIDALLLNRVWGTLIFFAVMYVVFQSLYSWAGPLMDLIDAGTSATQEMVRPLLSSTPALQSMVCDGIIAGVGGVLIFLPQILILFFFIALLEDTGYMARAAFLVDKLFSWCGLNGRSFVPLLSSYACAIPGVMATRTLSDPKARLTTILMAPFMSCSARLPVYILLIGTFIEPLYGPLVAGAVLFAMHFVGLALALPLAWILNRFFLKIKTQPFILEMPDYRVPTLRNIFHRMWERGREFVLRAGTVILAFSILIWSLLYFPRDPGVREKATQSFLAEAAASHSPTEIQTALEHPDSEMSSALTHRIDSAYIEQSYLGRFGKAVQPVFEPAGFDWKITVGVLSSFPAREVIIATLGIIYNLGSDVDEGSDDLRAVLQKEKWSEGPHAGEPVFTMPVVLGIMVFFALCMQCGATVAIIARELNWRWAALSFFGMTFLAWLSAVLIYQIGRLL